MKHWRRKWSYEIPLAFGDALWEILAVQFADFLSRLTIRRIVEFFVIDCTSQGSGSAAHHAASQSASKTRVKRADGAAQHSERDIFASFKPATPR